MRRRRFLALLPPVLASAASLPALGDQPPLVTDTGRFSLGGYYELQLRALSDGFDANHWYVSQWANVLNLEAELDLMTRPRGPFETISAFARVEVRYECVFTGCALLDTHEYFGDRASHAPARNWSDGRNELFAGPIAMPPFGSRRELHGEDVPPELRRLGRPVGDETELLNISVNPRFERAYEVGNRVANVEQAFAPVLRDEFAWKRIGGVRESRAIPLGPWNLDSTIHPNGALRSVASITPTLPLRPRSGDLYTPSAGLRRKLPSFGEFDQNFEEWELAWNKGASQDEWFLREAYVDIEMFEGRLWIRAGKQNIVWGKTELFRTTDQFNPQDIGLASLPTLEESRIALWSVRGVWDFYEVGPFQDVRLELAVNLDDFEPIDLGRCAEPYAPWLVCGKSSGLWAHGTTAFGIAGERRPPDFWDSAHGLEYGARLEWRWDRFSFAATGFYGFGDVAALELFHVYERSVDPRTGRPRDAFGAPLTPENALAAHPGNRQGFDVACRSVAGFGENALRSLAGDAGAIPDLSGQCLPALFNLQEPLRLTLGGALQLEVPPANAFGALLAGHAAGEVLVTVSRFGTEDLSGILAALSGQAPKQLVALNRDPGDGPNGPGAFGTDAEGPLAIFAGTANLSFHLTDEQEALLGCGPFYRTNCDADGIDLFNAEASVLLQSWPGFERNPVATRFENGKLFVLPGARGPRHRGYDRLVDGTPPQGFPSELAALSSNFATAVAILGRAEGDDDCRIDEVSTCATVRALMGFTGSQRPELRAAGNGRYGRRDFIWHGGGEATLFHPKRSVLGFSTDFVEDRTKTNWGVEFTWIDDDTFASNTSRTGNQESDVFNLTISVDRPTFVNFLNANRTFFFNSQVFVRYIGGWDRSFQVNGPVSVLATFAVTTGYFQDRLLPSLVLVHDFRSASGGVIGQISYRFTSQLSATVGALGFHGGPETTRVPRHPLVLEDTMTSFRYRRRYEGLSVLAERDEVFVKLRYTF